LSHDFVSHSERDSCALAPFKLRRIGLGQRVTLFAPTEPRVYNGRVELSVHLEDVDTER
jgi:hypothetical protein